MNIQAQIDEYIASQPEPKRSKMQALHERVLQVMPDGKLRFLDGKDDKGKTVSNPNIGYGTQTMKYTEPVLSRNESGFADRRSADSRRRF